MVVIYRLLIPTHTHSLHRGTRMVLVPLNVHYAAVAEEERVYWREAGQTV